MKPRSSERIFIRTCWTSDRATLGELCSLLLSGHWSWSGQVALKPDAADPASFRRSGLGSGFQEDITILSKQMNRLLAFFSPDKEQVPSNSPQRYRLLSVSCLTLSRELSLFCFYKPNCLLPPPLLKAWWRGLSGPPFPSCLSDYHFQDMVGV